MEKNRRINRRIVIISILFFLSVCGFVAKLAMLQIVEGDKLISKSAREHKKRVAGRMERGIIYDRNHNIMAASVKVNSVYAHPRYIKDKVHAAKMLAPLLGMKEQSVLKRLSLRKNFVYIKRKVPPSLLDKIKGLKIQGIDIGSEFKRIYPLKHLASSLIGFIGLDDKGLAGLEYKYNDYIKGRKETLLLEKDARGRSIEYRKDIKTKKGSDIVTTIDLTLQHIVERELAKRVTLFDAKGGTAIIMEPYSGDILALANYPSFNPNNFEQYPPEHWVNKAITYSYEPGSTFKLILAAAALEEKKADMEDMFFCENGKIDIGGITIHDTHNFKWLSMKKIIGMSSNIGAVKIGMRLKKELYYKYISRFGFGSKTRIDLPGEGTGIFHPLSSWTDSSIGALSIGHEISVTPIQLISAFSTIANSGIRVRPRVVKVIEKNGRSIKENPVRIAGQVISKETSRKLTDMLKYVVTDGTGKLSRIDGYSVAGKTGTAQKVDKETRTYSKERFMASFVGFLPAKNPRITILVMIDEPKDTIYGGKVAAPVFKNIAKQAMRYLRVPAERSKTQLLASL